MRDLTGRTDQTDHTGRRQNLAVATMAATALVAIVTVVVGPWRGGAEMSDSEAQSQPDQVVTPPPEVDTGRPHLIVSPATVPVAGGDVALIMANPGTEETGYGVLGLLERWNGSTWAGYRQVMISRTSQRTGKLHGLDEDLTIPLVFLSVGAGSFGRPGWTHVEGLAPGWYRFAFHSATGLLRVGGPPSTPLIRPTTAFAFSEGVVQAGTEATLHLTVMPREHLRGSFDVAEQVGGYTSEPLVERMDGERWSPVATDPVRVEDTDEVAAPFTLSLPPLEAGVYRVSREASVAGRIESLFWAAPLG
jgi:hypothetical protein